MKDRKPPSGSAALLFRLETLIVIAARRQDAGATLMPRAQSLGVVGGGVAGGGLVLLFAGAVVRGAVFEFIDPVPFTPLVVVVVVVVAVPLAPPFPRVVAPLDCWPLTRK